jgi:hypothetical protein
MIDLPMLFKASPGRIAKDWNNRKRNQVYPGIKGLVKGLNGLQWAATAG